MLTQTLNETLDNPSKIKTRLHLGYTVETTATPDQIWQVWTHVNEWPNWDNELEWTSLRGDFKLNAQGKVKAKSASVYPFTITDLIPGQSYTFSTRLLLCNLVERRMFRRNGETTYFFHEVSFKGLFALVFGLWLSQWFQIILPSIIEQLKTVCEASSFR